MGVEEIEGNDIEKFLGDLDAFLRRFINTNLNHVDSRKPIDDESDE